MRAAGAPSAASPSDGGGARQHQSDLEAIERREARRAVGGLAALCTAHVRLLLSLSCQRAAVPSLSAAFNEHAIAPVLAGEIALELDVEAASPSPPIYASQASFSHGGTANGRDEAASDDDDDDDSDACSSVASSPPVTPHRKSAPLLSMPLNLERLGYAHVLVVGYDAEACATLAAAARRLPPRLADALSRMPCV